MTYNLSGAQPLPSRPVPQPESVDPSERITIEVTDAARFLTLRPQWNALTRRAAEPNPFLDPAMVAAASSTGANQAHVLLAWQATRLVGVWALVRGRPRSGLPFPVLRAPIHPTMANGTPVIEAGLVEPVLAEMLDAIGLSSQMPKMLAIDFFNDGGPLGAALQSVCATRGRVPVVLLRAERPTLACNHDPESYFTDFMSGSRRRKLGQLRRRLASRGKLDLRVHRSAAAVSEALDRFMQLEAAGWKGDIGNPLLVTAGHKAFAHAAIPRLAENGCAAIWELTIDQQPVSMAIILHHCGGAFDWKITYDESYADCSPGVLLAQDYTRAFLSDPAIRFADSCAPDDTGLLGHLWAGRETMTSFMLRATPKASLRLATLVAIETCTARAKPVVKKSVYAIYARLRKFKWRRSRSIAALPA